MPHPVTSYEDVPYESKPVSATHPCRLAAAAALHGMAAPDVRHCRVLELGCAGGGNLVPMALALPESDFVGVDLSPGQVAEGQALVRALALRNIELKTLNLMAVDDRFGTFDYILCHGVWSWVPGPVRERILAVCSRNLSANGVAYVSYNTYPGWHARGMVRDMLAFHARRFADPHEQVRQARSFLGFLVGSVREPDGNYGRALRQEAELLGKQADSYLFHEHLEDVNLPVYFHEFMARAAAHGLQYLDEAQGTRLAACFPADVRETLRQLAPDPVLHEQYLDFLGNRTFRRTLLCRQGIALHRPPSPQAVQRFRYTTDCQPRASPVDLRQGVEATFASGKEITLTSIHPLIKAVLACLCEAQPRSLGLAELQRRVQGRLAGSSPSCGLAELAESLLHCHQSGIVEFHLHEPAFATALSPQPRASPLARHQAETGCPWITSLRHRVVAIDDFDRAVLGLLDGRRDRAALAGQLADLARRGRLSLPEAGVDDALGPALARLAGNALLIG